MPLHSALANGCTLLSEAFLNVLMRLLSSQEWLHAQLSPLLDHPLQTILDNQASPPAAASGGGITAAAGAAGKQQQAAVDWGAVGLAHVNAIAGSCFALGLRFAGVCPVTPDSAAAVVCTIGHRTRMTYTLYAAR